MNYRLDHRPDDPSRPFGTPRRGLLLRPPGSGPRSATLSLKRATTPRPRSMKRVSSRWWATCWMPRVGGSRSGRRLTRGWESTRWPLTMGWRSRARPSRSAPARTRRASSAPLERHSARSPSLQILPASGLSLAGSNRNCGLHKPRWQRKDRGLHNERENTRNKHHEPIGTKPEVRPQRRRCKAFA